MAFTFILLLAPQTYFPILGSLRIALVTAGLAITTHLIDRVRRRQPLLVPTPELGIAGALVGWAFLTVPFSYWPGGSVTFLLDFYLKTLAIFWLLSVIVDTPVRLRRVAWALSLMAIPLAVTAVVNYLNGAYMSGAQRIVGYEAPLTANPNDLALTLNLILPLTVALFLLDRRPLRRSLLLLVMALDVVAVVATYSRAGFVTLATTTGIYLWKRRRPGRLWTLAAVLLLLACVPLLPLLESGYLARLGTITDIESDPTGSAQARWNDMLVAMDWIFAHPIVGAGAGQNVVALNDLRGPTWKVVHNAYLEYGIDLGIPGLVLFLLLLGRSLGNARRAQRRCAGAPASRELLHLTEGIEVGLAAFAVGALFSPVGYHFYFYYMAGLAVAAKALSSAQDRTPSPAPHPAGGQS